MENGKTKSSRRNFLLAVGAGGAATVAAIAGKTASKQDVAEEKKETAGSGYQLSEHVRNYYRSTLV